MEGVLRLHFHFCSLQASPLARLSAPDKVGGGFATRHISRRALIGRRFSPDTAVIVFCGESPRPPVMSLHAVEWSAVLAVSSDDDVSKRRDHGPRRNEQEKQSGDLRLDHLAQAAPEPDPKTSGDQGKDQPSPHSRSCNRMQVGGGPFLFS